MWVSTVERLLCLDGAVDALLLTDDGGKVPRMVENVISEHADAESQALPETEAAVPLLMTELVSSLYPPSVLLSPWPSRL